MSIVVKPIMRLVNEFSKLPSVGKRTATRYCYKIIEMSDADVNSLIDAIKDVKAQVHYCKVCGNFTDKDTCDICSTRNSDTICVVKDPKDVATMEKMQTFNGVYHVLHGTISPLDGITPDDIKIRELLARITDKTQEIILALSPDVEGDATAMYISRLIKPLGVKVTRLAHGIPIGQDIEFADEITLSRAMTDRTEL
ncbi:MAG: recombination mediator RecR [Clostridia bacterium]